MKISRYKIPVKKETGAKTEIITSVVAITAKVTSVVPFMAASLGDSPNSKCRKIFSRTTIASSISSPTAKLSDNKVITLMVKPGINIKINAPSNETT